MPAATAGSGAPASCCRSGTHRHRAAAGAPPGARAGRLASRGRRRPGVVRGSGGGPRARVAGHSAGRRRGGARAPRARSAAGPSPWPASSARAARDTSPACARSRCNAAARCAGSRSSRRPRSRKGWPRARRWARCSGWTSIRVTEPGNERLRQAVAARLATRRTPLVLSGVHPWRPAELLAARTYAEIELTVPGLRGPQEHVGARAARRQRTAARRPRGALPDVGDGDARGGPRRARRGPHPRQRRAAAARRPARRRLRHRGAQAQRPLRDAGAARAWRRTTSSCRPICTDRCWRSRASSAHCRT